MLARPGRNVTEGVLGRETGASFLRGHGAFRQQRGLLGCITFDASSTTVPLPPSLVTQGLPHVAKYNQNPALSDCHLLAVGGDEGFITIFDTQHIGASDASSVDATSKRRRAHWACHRNSILDLAWVKGDAVMYTAGGDQTVGIWDTDTATALGVAVGHGGSVKSVAPLHLCPDVFATGGRDGCIMFWDARCPAGSGRAFARRGRLEGEDGLEGAPVLSPVWVQEGAHARAPPPGHAAAKAGPKANPVSVTSVAFIPYSYMLASGGAFDTTVKLWDLRMQGLPLCDVDLSPRGGRATASEGPFANAPHEVSSFACPTRGSAVGITHIATSHAGDRLLVSCLDSQHHLLPLARLGAIAPGATALPLASWAPPPPVLKASFYMRSVFSPCDDYVLCGSRGFGAHIWHTADPSLPPVALPHERDVTGVAWCPAEWGQVATCSDRRSEILVWALHRRPARAGEEAAAPAEAEATAATGAVVAGAVPAAAKAHSALSPAAAAHVTPRAAALRPAPLPGAHSTVRPAGRRLVQAQLNLVRGVTPVPMRPALAALSAGGGTSSAGAGDAHGGAAAAAATAAAAASIQAAGAAHGGPLPTARSPTTSAAAATPGSQPAPRPGGTPGSARRSAPAFSPTWRERQQKQREQFLTASAAAVTAAAADAAIVAAAMSSPVRPAAADATGPCSPVAAATLAAADAQVAGGRGSPAAVRGGSGRPDDLAPAMLGLAQIRTSSPQPRLAKPALAQEALQEPAPQQQPQPDAGLEVAAVAALSGAEAAITALPAATSLPRAAWQQLPPPAAQPEPQQLGSAAAAAPQHPQHAGPSTAAAAVAAAAARLPCKPAMSPRGTPSFQRSRSRLGPFSPCHSSGTSSGGGSGATSSASSGGGGSRGAGPSRASLQQQQQPHAAPQGVVAAILRGSPRPGAGAAPESLFTLPTPSPRSATHAAGAAHPASGSHGTSSAGRQLFAEGREFSQRLPPMPSLGHPQNYAPGASPRAGASIMRSPRSPGGALLGALGTPRSRQPPPPPPAMSPIVFDIQDGASVEPALAFRAAHPDDADAFPGGEEEEGAQEQQQQRPGAAEASGEAAHQRDAWLAGPPLPGGADAAMRLLTAPMRCSAGSGSDDDEAAAGAAGGADARRAGLLLAGLALRGSLDSDEGEHGGEDERARGRQGAVAAVDGEHLDDSDSDSDWEFDPYADKENTPPPPPLEEASPSALPLRSSGGGAATASGGSLPAASLRAAPLPAASPRTRPANSAESDGAPASARRPGAAAMPSPFAAASVAATRADSNSQRHNSEGSGGVDGSGLNAAFGTMGAVPSLHREPSAGADAGPGAAAARLSGSGSGAAGCEGLAALPSFGPECGLLPQLVRYSSVASSDDEAMDGCGGATDQAEACRRAAVCTPPRGHRAPSGNGGSASACGRRSYPGVGPTVAATASAHVAGYAAPLEQRHREDPTPTKRPRTAYLQSPGVAASAQDNDPNQSPPRSARHGGGFGFPAAVAPTPTGKRCASAAVAAAIAAAAPMAAATPYSRSRPASHAGGGRLGRLMHEAAATASGLQDGSASPAPKVGTASRTGGRMRTPAAEEYFARQQDADCDPFGFGNVPPPSDVPPPPSTARRLADAFGDDAPSSAPGAAAGAAPHAVRNTPGPRGTASRFAPAAAGAMSADGTRQGEGAAGGLAVDAWLHLPREPQQEEPWQEREPDAASVRSGAARRQRRNEGGLDEEEAEEEADGLTLQCSMRSLSCIFETQTQGASLMVVPCSLPATSGDEDGAQRSAGSRGGTAPPSRLTTRLAGIPEEERTAASPCALFAAGAHEWGGQESMEGSDIELGSAAAGSLERHGSFNFGAMFRRGAALGSAPLTSNGIGHHGGAPVGGAGISAVPPDEASRCVAAAAQAAAGAAPGGGLIPADILAAGRKQRQSTLLQCWTDGGAATGLAHVSTREAGAPAPQRALGPTGLASPRFFR